MYDFDEQKTKGLREEAVLDNFFSAHFVITKATEEEQRQGIDRWFEKKGLRKPVEYKADFLARKTGNVFLETVSVDVRNVKGWVWTSQADYLAYYLPHYRTLYWIPFTLVRFWMTNVWEEAYPTVNVPNRGYQSQGVLVPLSVWSQQCLGVYWLVGGGR